MDLHLDLLEWSAESPFGVVHAILTLLYSFLFSGTVFILYVNMFFYIFIMLNVVFLLFVGIISVACASRFVHCVI